MAGFVTINGQQIPWSFICKIRKACCGDWDRTIDAFWSARKATGENAIIKYVRKGLCAQVDRYTLRTSPERDAGRMAEIREWWYSHYKKPHKVDSIQDIVAEAFAAAAKGK